MKRRGGFTLIELLFSIALVALVMVASSMFIFSMGELWGRNADVRLFDLHVRNVSRFLTHELRAAAFPPAVAAGKAAIVIKEIRPGSGSTDDLLTFELPAGSRLLDWPARAIPDVECSLAVRDREGLLLLWHSKYEKRFADDPPRETVITPLVSGLAYDYYDPDFKRWKTETTLLKGTDGKIQMPQRLRLKFAYGKNTREAVIVLPVATEGLPML